jgi:hypothetical protein
MSDGSALRRNAVAFDAFCRDVEKRNGRVTVGLSGSTLVGEKEAPHDLVIHVSGPGVRLSKRVVGGMGVAIAQLRDRLKLTAP